MLAQQITHDWPNVWILRDASVLLDRDILNECPEDRHKTSTSRASFLAHYRPEVAVLLLGLQTEPKRQDEASSRLAVGLLLHPLLDLDLTRPASIQVWKRVGLFIWNTGSERSEVEGIRSDTPFKLVSSMLENLRTTFKHLPYLKGDSPERKHASGLFG